MVVLFLGVFILTKTAAHKENSREKSYIQEQSLTAGSNYQAGWGNMHSTDSGPGVTFIEGEG
jgi:hypothetical protein